MHGYYRLLSCTFAVCISLIYCQPPLLGQSASTKRLLHVNARARKLVALDAAARQNFEREHPGILPESKLKLPKSDVAAFDWCNLNKVSESHRQLNHDCWANAATESLECSYLLRNNHRETLSVQPVLDHLKLESKYIEGYASRAADFFLKTGTAKLSAYPYTGKPAHPHNVQLPYRAVAWGYVSQDGATATDEQLKEALLRHGPLPISVLRTKGFKSYMGGCFEGDDLEESDKLKTDHCVLLVGWNDEIGEEGAWKIKNTWGTGWGEQGFMWIAYGANNVGEHAVWMMAESIYYQLPDEWYRLIPDATRLPWIQYVPR